MNTYAKTEYRVNLFSSGRPSECTFETLTTGSWTVIAHSIDYHLIIDLYHNDIHDIPTGHTQVSDYLTLPTNHLWVLSGITDLRNNAIFDVIHTFVGPRVSSENISIKLFYSLFDRLTLDEYPKYMRVTAAFTDLKFDFLTTLQ